MLEHFFWLLEFKFRFEFYFCLNLFQTQTLIPKPLNYPPYLLVQPSRRPAQQPACAPAQTSKQQAAATAAAAQPAWPFGPAGRPAPRRSPLAR
jgi:hypothetical protein